MSKYTPKQFSPHLYPEWGELIADLEPEKAKEVFMAIFQYPNYNPNIGVWRFIKSQIDKDYNEFIIRNQAHKEVIKNYWENKKGQKETKENKCFPLLNKSEQEDNKGEPITYNININKNINKKKNKQKEKNYDAEFEEWWKICPKKVGKDKAFNKFKSILAEKKATIEELTDGMNRYLQKCIRDNTEDHYIKHPITWLNDGCWKDDYNAWKNIADKVPKSGGIGEWDKTPETYIVGDY